MLFTEVPPIRRPQAARDAGFSLIESWWPVADDVDGWVEAVASAGIGVSCLNANAGDLAAGERGFCNLAEHDERTFAEVGEALNLAMRVGAPCLNVLPGLTQGETPHATQVDHAVDIYRALGAMAAACNVTVVIEPINALDVPGYLLPTADDVAAVLARVDHPSVRMLFDAYHCARSGADAIDQIARHADLIRHAQYADCPGRGAPGTGDLPFDSVIEALDRCGYRGALGMEYAPGGPTESTLGFLHSHR